MKVNTTRRNVFAGLALAALIGTTGCSAVNPQATTFEYAPSDGTQTTITSEEVSDSASTEDDFNAPGEHVDFLNIGVITGSADDIGTLMGTIDNQSDSSQNVELQINNETFEFSLEAGEILKLEDEEITIDGVGTEPGGLAEGVATAFGQDKEFHVSILPPTLEEYRELYPGDLNEEEQIEHLYDFQGQYHRDEQ